MGAKCINSSPHSMLQGHTKRPVLSMRRVISSWSDLANLAVVSVDSLATREFSQAESGRREVNPSPKEFET